MRIIKLLEGFITNSSSVSATILLAARKGKKLGELFKKVGLSMEWEKEFKNDMDEIGEWFEDSIEYDDLLDEFDLYLMNYCTASWGDEPYAEYECEAYDVLSGYSYGEKRKSVLKDELILLYVLNEM